MKRLNLSFQLVEAVDALIGGVVQDNSPTGTLIAGYMIILRGTSAKAADIDPVGDIGQIILSSSLAGNLLTEQNGGFMVERTRAARGSTRLIQPVSIGDPLLITMFHDFDISGNLSHGNVYIVGPGDSLQWTLPAMDAADVQAGTVWEVHRMIADRGEALYIPRYQGRGVDPTEMRQTFNGRTASLMLQPAKTNDPDRISLFDSQQKRLVYLGWESGLAMTNAMWRYDQDEAAYFYFPLYSDSPDSVMKCFGTDKVYLETVGGTGVMEVSHCVVDPVPEPAVDLASTISMSQLSSEVSRVARSGIRRATASALISASGTQAPISPKKTSAAVPALAVETSAKI